METDYKYHLQKYHGTSTRHVCPQCGQKGTFTLYVDDGDQPLHETVGRCDRESACGYHYTPREYFRDHPEAKPDAEDWRKAPDWLEKGAKPQPRPAIPAKPKTLCVIPPDIVSRSVSFRTKSDFVRFLDSILDPVIVEDLISEYRLGVTRSGAVIFFQIDVQGRCRTGKMMMYNPETGHRIKDGNTPNRINWVHATMKKYGQLPEDWELTQCIFGEHLLPKYPDKPVALVESEKTAVICAGLLPKYLWLATGGKSQISPEKLAVLAKRKVTAFPDVDGFTEWSQKLSAIPGLNVTVADILQKNATPQDFQDQIDIADWLLRSRTHPIGEDGRRHSIAFLKASKYISPEYHEELEALIDDLDLDFWNAEQVEVEDDDLPP